MSLGGLSATCPTVLLVVRAISAVVITIARVPADSFAFAPALAFAFALPELLGRGKSFLLRDAVFVFLFVFSFSFNQVCTKLVVTLDELDFVIIDTGTFVVRVPDDGCEKFCVSTEDLLHRRVSRA